MNIRRRLALGIILTAPALTMSGMAQLSAAIATPRIGQPAPNFVALDSNGQTIRLQDFRGKVVVLEWTNDGCPFVGKCVEVSTSPDRQCVVTVMDQAA